MEQRAELSGKNMRTAQVLAFCGTLPFLFAIVAMINHPSVFRMVALYGATIISFLAATHWAAFLFFSSRCPRNLMLSSIGVSLIAFLSIIVTLQPLVFLMQCLAFLYLLLMDHRLMLAGVWRPWYFRLRRNVTFVVISCEVVLVAGSLMAW